MCGATPHTPRPPRTNAAHAAQLRAVQNVPEAHRTPGAHHTPTEARTAAERGVLPVRCRAAGRGCGRRHCGASTSG
eukprot:6881597-Prymnesium_polylepis.1